MSLRFTLHDSSRRRVTELSNLCGLAQVRAVKKSCHAALVFSHKLQPCKRYKLPQKLSSATPNRDKTSQRKHRKKHPASNVAAESAHHCHVANVTKACDNNTQTIPNNMVLWQRLANMQAGLETFNQQPKHIGFLDSKKWSSPVLPAVLLGGVGHHFLLV